MRESRKRIANGLDSCLRRDDAKNTMMVDYKSRLMGNDVSLHLKMLDTGCWLLDTVGVPTDGYEGVGADLCVCPNDIRRFHW